MTALLLKQAGTPVGIFETWATISTVALTAVAGDILTAGAMRRIGDLDLIRAKSGLPGAIKAVIGSPMFLLGVGSMAVSFFALLFTVSVVDVSLAMPASAAMTNIGNAFAAKFFLHENVDGRRWISAAFVTAGVILLAK